MQVCHVTLQPEMKAIPVCGFVLLRLPALSLREMIGASRSSVGRIVTPGRVSIITAVYNAAPTLEQCLLSVRSQSYREVEHIVIDGGSTDGSVEILQRHSSLLAYSVSEPDSGVYDAWNKGLSVATGEWIAFLGAEDILLPDAMSKYLAVCGGTDAQYVSSLVRWIRPGLPDKITGRPWSWPAFQRKMTTAHVGSLHRFDLFEKYGNYDTGYKIAGDYELLLRPGKDLNSRTPPLT
jgi:glycosyltransferase involved in cell wall biosynthesis